MRPHLISLLAAIVVTVLTAWYERTGAEFIPYEGVDPGWSYTRVTVGGWPLPYLYDKPYFSPANRVGWVGVALRMDSFRAWPFVGDVGIYFTVATFARIRRRPPR
jgi:hypothetical protein